MIPGHEVSGVVTTLGYGTTGVAVGDAVYGLTDWYRDGADVQARLPLLSTWLGHVDPKSTYWYLQAVPELLALAAGRLEAAGGQPGE